MQIQSCLGYVLGIWVFPKIGGTAKMDGENDGKPYFLMDDLRVPLFSETSICWTTSLANFIEIPNLVVVFQPPKTSLALPSSKLT